MNSRINNDNFWLWIRELENGNKVPRKVKKTILGERIGKCKLNRMIKDFKVIRKQKHIYEATIYNMNPFCPDCGCELSYSTGNMAPYPELWERVYCLRCGKLVCEADNSVYYHVLEEMMADRDAGLIRNYDDNIIF